MERQNSDNFPVSSNTISITHELHTHQGDDDMSINSREIYAQILDIPEHQTNNTTPRIKQESCNIEMPVPAVLPNKGHPLRISSNLPSPISLNMPQSNHPQTLFLQALAKLNESSLCLAITADERVDNRQFLFNSTEVTPPESLTSAPPSYSFVLRQMAAKRPRLMGTFIPSPSYVQHTPPPNYATAFDIYVDNPLPAPPPPRACNLGFTSTIFVCPECGYTGMTVVASKTTLCTHLCAVILCLLCCWICAPLPYILKSCKDVYHYCSNCRNFLGMYCPTNPENASS